MRTRPTPNFYNMDNKMAFIEYYGGIVNTKSDWEHFLISIFNKSERVETQQQKDLCNFSKEEISHLYRTFSSTNVDRLNNINGILRKYTNWCMSEKLVLDGQNHYEDFSYSNLASCVMDSYFENNAFTRELLIQWNEEVKKTIVAYEKEKTKDGLMWKEQYSLDKKTNRKYGVITGRLFLNPSDLALIWLIFEGVRGKHYKELINLTYDDFDFNNNTVRLYDGKEMKLSDECMEMVAIASRMDMYVLKSGKRMPFMDRYVCQGYRRDQVDDEDIEDRVGEDERAQILYVNRLSRRLNSALSDVKANKVSLNAISAWGQIDFIKTSMEKHGLDAKTYLYTVGGNELRERFGLSLMNVERYYLKYKKYIEEEQED